MSTAYGLAVARARLAQLRAAYLTHQPTAHALGAVEALELLDAELRQDTPTTPPIGAPRYV